MQKKIFAALTLGGALFVLFVWANYGDHPLPIDTRVDEIQVSKSEHRLVLLQQGKPLKTYRIALGPMPAGHKEREGDGKTPEGLYRIDSHKLDSAFHRALHVSYPNERDIQIAKSKGVDPGGAIMIHGIRNGLGWIGMLHRLVDWTAGCIAVTNWEIDELWRVVPDGTPIVIRP
ncbi:MAG: L,D-transpeptidase family protein [Syntrophobacteraceae bacterium]|jgi:murein L,D-transpeptidase YafK